MYADTAKFPAPFLLERSSKAFWYYQATAVLACFFPRHLAVSVAMTKRKNPHAVALGRLGGLKGGKARTAKLTPEQRTELARKAVLARWAKEKDKK
jgi:hypothetical protein